MGEQIWTHTELRIPVDADAAFIAKVNELVDGMGLEESGDREGHIWHLQGPANFGYYGIEQELHALHEMGCEWNCRTESYEGEAGDTQTARIGDDEIRGFECNDDGESTVTISILVSLLERSADVRKGLTEMVAERSLPAWNIDNDNEEASE